MENAGSAQHRELKKRRLDARVSEALSRLPADMREVLILRHLERHTFPEIAQRMDRPLNDIERLWRQGLLKLRDEVNDGASTAD